MSYVWYGSIVDGEVDPSLVSDEAIRVVGWGTPSVSSCCRCPDLPAMRTGWRWRPGLRMPSEDARRIGALGGAGIIALLAQQAAVVVTMWLSKESGDVGTITVYTYAQAVYLLPYAVLAVPVATSAFPALAARTGRGRGRLARHAAPHAARGARAHRAVGGGARRGGAGHRGVLLLDARRASR